MDPRSWIPASVIAIKDRDCISIGKRDYSARDYSSIVWTIVQTWQ